MKIKLIVAAFSAILIAESVLAVQGTITVKGNSRKGDIRYRSRDKMYLLSSQRKGGATIEIEYKADEVENLDIPKPQNYDRAVELVTKGQGVSAISMLVEIVNTYKKLVWDIPAGRYLVEAYLDANNAQKALETAQGIIRESKESAYVGDLAPAYWKALLKLGKQQQLESLLVKAVSEGNRRSSAAAQLLRGDIILATAGQNAENIRKALIDGYLRVALMYKDEECRDICKEAMEKAAQCFDKIGWAERAENLRSQARMM